MKKELKSAMLAFAVVASTFTSCSNDAEEPVVNPDGAKGSIALTIKTGELNTRAVTTTQTAAESKLNTVSVLVFRGSGAGNLEKIVDLNVGTDLLPAGTNQYTLNTPIEVIAEANKKIVLVGNISTSIKNKIVAEGMNALGATYNETLARLTEADKFVMASAVLTENVSVSNTAITPLLLNNGNPIDLERLAAKVAVVHSLSGTEVSVAGGTIALTSVKYSVDNVNTLFNLVTTGQKSPFIAFVPPIANVFNDVVKDPNGPVNNSFYVMENIAKSTADDATYARVRCKFVPSSVLNGSGTTGTYSPNGTFAILAMANGTVAFFESAAAAQNFQTNNPSLVAPGATVIEYKEGLCDYGITLEKNPGEFDVVRNTYYVITITGFGGIGIPTDPLTPIPPTSNGSIKFDVKVKDWEGSFNDQTLS
ncbi:fimbria major subunit [Massilibacteroides vaginae]|uniref:fimbria major subunit n=1 Tax=Massilibacteroides vaginae TaxID=1673718 RepID=UPI000A1C9917|nr:fimbria major subunit [Massilibacteroides vaginae]